LEVIVAQTPAPTQVDAAMAAQGGDQTEVPTVMGLWFANLTPDLRREFHLAASVQGVVIGGIDANSAAAAIGLIAGDVVISIDRQPIAEPAEAMQKLRLAANDGDVLLLINRHGDNRFIVLSGLSKTGND
jgi:serine protease Do